MVVTQPRRIAARAAARRLASLLGEPVGRTVGYTVRGERRAAPATRVEVVTTGVLLRRLQRDPELPGSGAVVLDEVHERQLDADLALALLVDVRDNLRDDLRWWRCPRPSRPSGPRRCSAAAPAPVVRVAGRPAPGRPRSGARCRPA